MTTAIAPDWTSISHADQLAIIEASTGPLKKVANTRGGEYGHVPCPFCGGNDRFWLQFDGNQLVWFCRHCNELGGDVIDFLRKQGKSYAEAIDALGQPSPNLDKVKSANLRTSEPANGNGDLSLRKDKHREPVATFYYTDSLRVQRYNDPKEYIPEHLEGDRWIAGIGNRADWPLYGQFFIETAEPDEWILFTEGEKTAEALKPTGFTVTCIQGGAKIAKNNWQPHYTEALQGRKVAILRDQDKDGHSFGQHVKEHLEGHAAEVRIIDLPGLQYRESHGEDPENWRERGGTTAELNKILAAPPALTLGPKWLSTADMMALPPVEFLIPDMLPANSLALLYGPSEAGKSFLALDWAASLACQGKPVMYFVLEGKQGMGNKRIPAWVQHHDKQIPNTLHWTSEPVNLLDDQALVELLNTAAIVKPALMVFDTLAYMLGTANCDENSATDMGRFLAACQRIQQETGCTVLLLHHPTKDGKWERGSGALRGACDAIIEMNNVDSYVTVSCSKSKDFSPFSDKHYQLIPMADSLVLVDSAVVVWSEAQGLSNNEWKVLDVLSWPTFIDVGAKAGTIAEQTGIHTKAIYRVLSTLSKRGLIGQGKKGEPFYLTEVGRQVVENSNRDSGLKPSR